MKSRWTATDRRMASILITGGAGFIGRHLAKLAQTGGHHVRLLDNLSPQIHGRDAQFIPPQGVEFQLGDINCASDLQRAIEGIDCVVHLAAETGTGQSMYEIDRYYRVNVQGLALLLDLLANERHSVTNLLLASSRSVYGEGAYLCRSCGPEVKRCFPLGRSVEQLSAHEWNPKCPTCNGDVEPTGTRETDPTSPASIYAATKLAQEDMVRISAKSHSIAHSILRLQNVFGEGQSLANPYTGILSIFSTRIRLGLSLPIFEDGEESRDFIHVQDVARAFLSCIERPDTDGATFNIGSGEPTSVMAVAQLLTRIMGSRIEPHVTGQYRIGDIRHNFADLSLVHSSTGFRPSVSLEEGLQRFCDWVATQPIPENLLEKANSELAERKLMGE